MRAIARELNVGLVVTGSVQRDEDSMSINASVVDTRDGATLWSEHFSSKMADVLAVQNDISVQIAHTLSRRSASPRRRHQGRRREVLRRMRRTCVVCGI